ncbi:DUF2281 domain-containing protein [Algoriphagus sp.]|uniref:type II toxin-antitoxin system VapB family antitoxin n=1 Tax=Algoriphagus sp. TaxID=1872435 RepID=UPI0039192DD2
MASQSLLTKLESLPPALKEEAKNFIEFLVEKSKKTKPKSKVKKPSFGSLKGKIHLSEDFDAPLDEFKVYM